MPDEVVLPESFERYLEKPFMGLFGDSAHAKVLLELVADPYHDFRPKDIKALTGLSDPSIREALATFLDLGLVTNISDDGHRPRYRVNLDSKTILSLTFLTYALLDDREGSSHLEDSIGHYCRSILGADRLALSGATAAAYGPEVVAARSSYKMPERPVIDQKRDINTVVAGY